MIKSLKTFSVINPYTNKVVGDVPISSPKKLLEVLSNSYKYRCELSKAEKINILSNCLKKIINSKDSLSALITSESGLSIKDSLHEVDRAINCLNYSIKLIPLINDNISSKFIFDDNISIPKLDVLREPMNLAIGITPFNHPLNLVMHKLAPSIISGTPIVLKPSEKTPLTAIRLHEILIESGLPLNHINIVHGFPPKEVVDQLITYPKIDLVTVTGGVNIGKYIESKMIQGGNYFKKFMPELGGNAIFVVMNDCDLELATNLALASFENSGQRCTAIRRILLQKDIYNDFIDHFIEKTKNLKLGNPMDPKTDIGTVISNEQVDLIQQRILEAEKEGAKVVFGNNRNGAQLEPTIVKDVNINSKLVAEETFGPIASIIKINDLDQAIDYIKNDKFGLASAIATSEKKSATKLYNNICVGQFSWNGPPGYRTEAAPFGGFGVSGNGEKEGIVMMTQALQRIRAFYEH